MRRKFILMPLIVSSKAIKGIHKELLRMYKKQGHVFVLNGGRDYSLPPQTDQSLMSSIEVHHPHAAGVMQ